MKFHLDYNPPVLPISLSHSQSILLAGSCFTESIGRLLQQYRFNTLCNPHGIAFNPVSIARSLASAISSGPFHDQHMIRHNGKYFSYLCHSSLAAGSRQELKQLIAGKNQLTADFLQEASCLIISFGSAHAYVLRESNEVVANCHKQDPSLFEKILLKPETIVATYNELIKSVRQINPGLKILFTVSPVKYLKDGVIGNTLSKATLILAAHEIIGQNGNCWYFPAFELLNDDLRDYRFYKPDLAHPNEPAISYIWEKFTASVCAPRTRELLEHITRFDQALAHRPMHTLQDSALDAFIERQRRIILDLEPGLRL